MEKIDALNQVAEFHQTFKHPVLDTPTIPDEKRCALRVALLAEELQELSEAIQKHDIVAVADALCDLQYVLSGAVLEFGLGSQFAQLFNEVQRSNMSKACETREEAEATVAYYKKEKDTASYIKEEEGRYLVYRKEDHKTLKSIRYSPADLQSIIQQKEKTALDL